MSRRRAFLAALALACAPRPASTGAPALQRIPRGRAGRSASGLDRAPAERPGYPSRFGKLTSSRWAYGARYRRANLSPVPNPNPSPEPQPPRDRPYDVEVSKDGTKVYISLLGSEARPGSEVAVYDVRRDRIIRRIPLRPPGESGPPASGPFRLALHPSGRFLATTNKFSNFLTVIETKSDSVVGEIPLDFYAQGMVFDAAGRVLYVADRYLDQVLVVDVRAANGRLGGAVRELGGLDDRDFRRPGRLEGIHSILARRCAKCHDPARGGFYAGPDKTETFASVLDNVELGDAASSRLLRAVTPTADGGYADRVPRFRSHGGIVVFPSPGTDPDYRALARWIDGASEGPGIPVGNPRSKPKILALSSDGRHLFVGNTGTQDISIVDTKLLREVGAIYVQNVVNDIKIFRSTATGRDYLLVATEGVGFGVAKERDPDGGESWDRANPAAHFSVRRDLNTGAALPKSEQDVLGPFDAVDGTAGIKFRDIQNDVLMVDVGALRIPDAVPSGGLSHILLANRNEAHRGWVRYTSDTAESTYGDIKGDLPPDLLRVVGALPEKMAVVGDRLLVTMQGSDQVQEWRIDPAAREPSDALTPVAVYSTGLQPIGVAAGRTGTPSEGKAYVADFLGGTLSVIDRRTGRSREVVVDPSVLARPVPDTNAERGELFAHTALFSSDGDSSCFHCHYFDTGDGRPWGVSQVVGQDYPSGRDARGQLVIGGTMGVPQMRGLFKIQPFFYEGVLSAFEPRSMIMEHCPADDFNMPIPGGDYTGLEAHYPGTAPSEIQSSMDTSAAHLASLEERRDEMFRERSMRYFGKAFALRDFQRFVGEWQIHEPRLLPNPFDPASRSVRRGRALFEDPQVGCAACHPAPNFAKKDFPDNPEQALPSVVTLTPRDAAFTLIGMNRLDAINGIRRDLEPWDAGRAKKGPGRFTVFPLRGLWDRPPVFLHNGMARSLREVAATPGHPGLRRFKYEPLLGGVPERPGRREVGFNETYIFAEKAPRLKAHLDSGARIGYDTHGGTSHLTGRELDDLVNYLESLE